MTGYGSNISSLRAQRRLSQSTARASLLYERLASGQRINRASDDAASLAVASSLKLNSRVFGQAIRNINDGVSMLNVADGSLEQLSGILQRQIELAAQSANGSYSNTQRSAMDSELQELNSEYNRIVAGTRFNGLGLLSGEDARIYLQAGRGNTNSYQVDLLERAYETRGTGLSDVLSSDVWGDIIATADLNGDGRDDVVTLEASGGTFRIGIYVTEEDGTLVGDQVINLGTWEDYTLGPASSLSAFSLTSIEVGTGFADGNSTYDIGYYIEFEYDSSSIAPGLTAVVSGSLLNSGAGVYTPSAASPAITLATVSEVSADFNGDGVEDFADAFGNLEVQRTTQVEVAQSLLQASLSIDTQGAAQLALDTLRDSLENISERRGAYGGMLSRLGSGLANLQGQRSAYESAFSRIMDTDVAADVASLTQASILQEIGVGILAQANLNPKLALQLLVS